MEASLEIVEENQLHLPTSSPQPLLNLENYSHDHEVNLTDHCSKLVISSLVSNIVPAALPSKLAFLTRFHAGYFRISLSLSSQALLWKVLSGPTATKNYGSRPLHSLAAHLIPPAGFLFLWCLSLFSLVTLSALYSLRCLLRFPSIRKEFAHHVGVNYLFAPWISCLLLLQSSPFIHPKTHAYTILFWVSTAPILILDVKIYGQWFTKGKKYLTMVANPTCQLSVIGNLVGARAAADMGWTECATCMFSLGMAHYLVLFVTLYQRFQCEGGYSSLPAMMRPVFFQFFAAPGMASVAWYAIGKRFDTACKMLFYLSLFIFASLVSRPALFKRSMKRFNVAWWAYSYPLTILALASTRYAQEVKGSIPNLLMLILSILSVVVTLVLMAVTAIKRRNILPRNDPFDASSELLPTTSRTTSTL